MLWFDLLLLAFGVILTFGTGLFVAAEFALVNLDRSDLEARQRGGEKGLDRTIAALKITSTHLSSAQLGITVTTLLAGYTFEPALSAFLEAPLSALGVPDDVRTPIGVVVGLLIATVISMILGELLPKNVALALPIRVAKLVMPFQSGFTMVFRPAVRLLNGTANRVLHLIGVEPKEELSGARTAQELSSLVRRSAMEGVLDTDTATLLERTLNFSGHTAADVMTPRPRLSTIARSASAADVLRLAGRTGFSRFPVTGEDGVDDVVALVHVKQAMAVPRDRRADVPVGAIETEALRVPETMTLDALLGELRGRGYQMAVVLDEYGGTAGVATLEDCVEELVGDLVEEHDRTRAGIVRGLDSLTFPGILRPDELLDQAGVKVPESGLYETVAGFVVSELGRLPQVGDTVGTEQGGLEVLRLEGRRIDRLRFRADPDAPANRIETGGGQPVSDWAGIGWLVLLLIVNAFFVASEFAVISARRSQIEPLAEQGRRSARVALGAMEHATLMLSTTQLGITVASLLILNVSEPAIHHLLEIPLHLTGLPEEALGVVAFVVTLLIVTFLHVIFGEMVPKNLAFSLPDRAVLLLATPLVFVERVFRPLIFALNGVTNALVRLVGVEPKDEASSTFTIDEVETIVATSRREGTLDDTSGTLTAAFDFTEKQVAEVAVPMREIVSLPETATPADLERAVAQSGFSRYILVDGEGEPTGYLHLKDVLELDEGQIERPIPAKFVRRLTNVYSGTELEDALAALRRSRQHLAKVVDQDGTTQGVLFLEDVIEELVGEVQDATRR